MRMPLFPDRSGGSTRPLADRMRPESLDDVVGQPALTGPGGLLRELIEAGRIPSLIFWGPPGSGKSTLAVILALGTSARFVPFSAVLGGVQEIRRIVSDAEEILRNTGRNTVMFVDEIHRFNKSQQDAFLPHVEKGTITLIGTTTENPAFEVNSALLSRCTVVRLNALKEEDVVSLLRRAVWDPRGLAGAVEVTDEAIGMIASIADGDARRGLNLLEQGAWIASKRKSALTAELVREAFAKQPLRHDKSGDRHYDVVSAFIKSMRGSDPDAAMYWMLRMLEAGEDPLFIIRRMVIFASEDIGNADPRALQVAINTLHAFQLLGLPEGKIPMAQAVTYLSTAPKSNASYLALKAAEADVQKFSSLEVPMHLRNAPTKLMRQMGAGKEYRYPHDYPKGYVNQKYLPDEMPATSYYEPKETGYERHIRALMEWRKQS